MSKTDTQSTQVVLFGRFSFLNFHAPKAAPGSDKPKYSVCLLMSKKDTKTAADAEAAINAALTAKFGAKIPKGLKMPIRDGDKPEDNKKDRAEMKGHWYVNATSFDKPGFVDKDRKPIMEKEEIYSGMYGYIQVNFYYFDKGMNKGIACGLNNCMKVKDGENLTGREDAENAFADVDVSFADDNNSDLD